MNINNIFEKFPYLKKINYSVLNKIYINRYNIPLNWDEINSFDELDYIEFIMDIEHKLDIIINDEVTDFLVKDNNFQKIFNKSIYRKEVLDNLLNFTKS